MASISISTKQWFQYINLKNLRAWYSNFNNYNSLKCHHVRTIKVSEIYCVYSNNVMTTLLVGVAQCEFFAN